MAGMKRKRSSTSKSAKRAKRAVAFGPPSVRNWAAPINRITRKFYGATYVPGTNAWQHFEPTLSLLPSLSLLELTNLYDEYKIDRIHVEVLPRFNSFDAGSSTVNPLPLLSYFADPSNSYPVSGTYGSAQFQIFASRCNNGFKTVALDKGVKFSWRPNVATTDGEIKAFPWTSTASSTRACMSCDLYLHAVNFAAFPATTEYDVYWTYDISVRGMR